jgi:hypothetical protein
MGEPRGASPLSWQERAGLALLAVLVLAASMSKGLTLVQTLAFAGAGAGVLVLAWLWRLTLRRAETSAPALTRGQRGWNAVVLVLWLAAMAGVVWFYAGGGER